MGLTVAELEQEINALKTAEGAVTQELEDARGSVSSLANRLSVALNLDGTLRVTSSTVSFALEMAAILSYPPTGAYVALVGDLTDIYREGVRTRVNEDNDLIRYVSSSEYVALGDYTIVTFSAPVGGLIASLEHGMREDSLPLISHDSLGALELVTSAVDDTPKHLSDSQYSAIAEHLANETDAHDASTGPQPATLARRTSRGCVQTNDADEQFEAVNYGQVMTWLNAKASRVDPALTGNVTAPTLAADNESTGVATTAHVLARIEREAPGGILASAIPRYTATNKLLAHNAAAANECVALQQFFVNWGYGMLVLPAMNESNVADSFKIKWGTVTAGAEGVWTTHTLDFGIFTVAMVGVLITPYTAAARLDPILAAQPVNLTQFRTYNHGYNGYTLTYVAWGH